MIRAICSLALLVTGAEDKPAPLSAHYGFLPPEIYKLDFRTKNLLLRDVNGDGRLDIVVVNGLRNRIDVLEQRKPGEKAVPEETSEANELPTDWRLRHRKIPASRAPASLEVKDVDGDGRADLVYLGDPAGLYIEYQSGDGGFGRRREFDNADAQQNSWMLDVGDINSDQRNDVVFLGKENLYIAYQRDDGRLEDPRRYRLAESGASLLRIVDIDGDGRNDITFQSEDKQFPVRVRFQAKSGRIGAERRFSIDPPRGVSFANLDKKPGEEMLIISEPTDRLLLYGLAPAERGDAPTSKLVAFPFEKSGASQLNDLAVADVDGDGRSDVVVSDPDAARLLLYRHAEGEGLDLGQPYPGLLGATILRVLRLSGGPNEVLSLSDRENAIGATRFEGNRLLYPRIVPTKDQPVVMEVVGAGGASKLAYVARRQAGGGGEKFFLRVLSPSREGDQIAWKAEKLGDSEEIPLEFPGKPADLMALDADGDGHQDLLFFFLYQSPLVWRGDGKGSFQPIDRAAQGSIGNVAPAAAYFGPFGGKEPVFLVAQNNFARRLKLDPNGRWQALDQYTASPSGGSILGVAPLDVDGDKKPELAMYDRSAKSVVFLKEQEGLYRRWRQLSTGSFALRGMRTADFDGDAKEDLLLFDANQMGIAYVGKQDLELKQLASYESDIKKGKLFDVVPGDLNHDGGLDLLLLEPLGHHLEIVAWLGDGKLKRATSWKVFEEKTFRQAARSLEPREVAIGDVNDDRREDIVALVHDRVLVYLQDPGPEAAAAAPAAND